MPELNKRPTMVVFFATSKEQDLIDGLSQELLKYLRLMKRSKEIRNNRKISKLGGDTI